LPWNLNGSSANPQGALKLRWPFKVDPHCSHPGTFIFLHQPATGCRLSLERDVGVRADNTLYN
jgi:hypothetical protein